LGYALINETDFGSGLFAKSTVYLKFVRLQLLTRTLLLCGGHLRDGRIVKFWDDIWVSNLGPLRSEYIGSSSLDDSLLVSDMVN
ncbi:hypothetical protein J1N35_044463, partial [Gossypium stocksii]